MKCDQKTMTLVERNRRHKFQPPEEIADLYRCKACNSEMLFVVQEDPGTLYH